MENSNITKQAKSDIFKELYPIINFYIKKGAKPKALKKYYKNTKRFNDILDDIRNKGINLVKDEGEYKKLVKSILNEILDDIIAKNKDLEYKNKKLKHIKEFNSYNESSFPFFKKFLKKKSKTQEPIIEEKPKIQEIPVRWTGAYIYNGDHVMLKVGDYTNKGFITDIVNDIHATIVTDEGVFTDPEKLTVFKGDDLEEFITAKKYNL